MNSTVQMNRELAGRRDDQEDISFRDLLLEIVKMRLVILCIVGATTVGGFLLGLVIERKYEAITILSPASEESGSRGAGGLGSLASQYSGLASLVGISLPGGSHKDEAVAVLQSELLTESYLRDQNLLPVLFAKQWNAAEKKWLTTDPKKTPSLWKGNQYFKTNVRTVTDDKKSGMIILSIKWKDPQIAAKWANDLVKRTNEYLRDKAIREAQRNIAYLNIQAAQTNVVEARKAIYALLEEELNKEMVARGREEYALKVIDPAFAPEKPASAGPMVMSAIGFAVGLFIALLIVFGRRILLA